jgi:hypothetical protein
VSSLELGSVTVQARLGSTRLLYKLDSVTVQARLSSTRLGSFTGLYAMDPYSSRELMPPKQERDSGINIPLDFIKIIFD